MSPQTWWTVVVTFSLAFHDLPAVYSSALGLRTSIESSQDSLTERSSNAALSLQTSIATAPRDLIDARSLLDVAIYIGTGYDLLHGSPDGASLTTGGMDPGLKIAKPILHQTPLPQGCIQEANCVLFDTTITDQQSSTDIDMRSYQSSLDNSWSFEGKLGLGMFKAKGGASRASKQAAEEFRSQESVIVSQRNLTMFGEIAYSYHEYPRLSNNFMAAVCQLPNEYAPYDYVPFLKEWGTHVVTSARFGVRSADRLIATKAAFSQAFNDYTATSVSAGLSFGSLVSASMTYSMSNSISQSLMTKASDSSVSHLVIGTVERPAPIAFTLRPIDYFVNDRYLNASVEFVKDCPLLKSNVTRISENLAKALEDYPKLEGLDTSDLEQVNRNLEAEWPVGQYALLSGGGKCPEGWANGTRRTTFFTFEQGLTVPYGFLSTPRAGVLFSEWTATFCTKRVERETVGGSPKLWQQGSYCIFRKDGTCPTGFIGTGLLRTAYAMTPSDVVVVVPEPVTTGSIADESNGTDVASKYSANQPFEVTEHVTRGNIADESTNSAANDASGFSYCCRDDGPVDRPLTLPRDANITLLPIGKACQVISGMNSTLIAVSTAVSGRLMLPHPWTEIWTEHQPLAYQSTAAPSPYAEVDYHGYKTTIYFCEYRPSRHQSY